MDTREQWPLFLDRVFWRPIDTASQIRVQAYFFVTLFLIGVIYWIGFFHLGSVSLTAYDWGKEVAYLNTLRLAQETHTIPWEWEQPYFQDTTKFLANPEVVLTPDIFFLHWISNNSFIIFHILISYSIGFLGAFLLTRELNVRLIPFNFFWLVFNFNGYITAHIAVGHFQWTAYFFLPFFFLILFKLTAEPQPPSAFKSRFVLIMGLLLGVLFLNGSVHTAIWCYLFLFLTALFKRSHLSSIFLAIIIGLMLGLGRLLPAALWFPRKEHLLVGYPTFSSLLDALTSLRLHSFTGIQELGMGGWWEYNVYIGYAALIILVTSLYLVIKRNKFPCEPYLIIPSALLLLLSLGFVYNIVNMLPLPFAGIERIPSRFVVRPLIFFLIVSMKGVDELVTLWGKTARTFVVLGLLMATGELAFHFSFWRVDYVEQWFRVLPQPAIAFVPCMNEIYKGTVFVSWSISLITFLIVISFLFRKPYTSHPSTPPAVHMRPTLQ